MKKLKLVSFLILFTYSPNILCMTSVNNPGLETVQVSDEKIGSQGNWLKKKNWLLKSYEINANIYDLTKQIIQTKSVYQSKYSAIDEELDNFYKDLGIEEGKVKELFDNINKYLEKKKAKDIASSTSMQSEKTDDKSDKANQDFSIKVEAIENQVKQKSLELEQLKLDMDSITDLDKSLTQRLQKVDEQITSAMSQSEAAKTKAEDLWDIIDDKKARAIYYDILNIQANLTTILSYLKDILAGDFDKVIEVAKGKLASVTSGIKKLEADGLIIKDRANRVEQIKLEEKRKNELNAAQAKKIEVVKQPDKKEPETGLVQKIYALIVDNIARVYTFFVNLFSTNKPNKTVNNKPSQEASQSPSQPGVAKPESPTVSVPKMPNAVSTSIPVPSMPVPDMPLPGSNA